MKYKQCQLKLFLSDRDVLCYFLAGIFHQNSSWCSEFEHSTCFQFK